MKETIIEGLKALLQVTPQQYELYGDAALPIVSTIVSALFMFMKKLFKVNRPAFMFFSVTIFSVTAGLGLYLADIANGNPMVVGLLAPLLTLISYHFVLRPVTKRYAPKLASWIENARLYKAQKQNKPVVSEEIPGRVV